MKKLLFPPSLALLLCVINSGCVLPPGIAGSGTITTTKPEVGDFNAVSIGGPGEVRITQGNTESLEVRADDNLMPYLRVEARGRQLRIDWKHGHLRFSEAPVYTLAVKDLRQLRLSGSLHAEMDRLDTEDFDGRISGSGKIEFRHLDARQVRARISGSGDLVILNGSADSFEVDVSGSGSIRTADFSAKAVEVSISGSGSAQVRAVETLDAQVSGSGNVRYYGSPKVSSSVSGSGRIQGAGPGR